LHVWPSSALGLSPPRLGSKNLRLRLPHLTPVLNSGLFHSSLLLLIIDGLLARRFTLGSLLVAHRLALVLRGRGRLCHTSALCLRRRDTIDSTSLELLSSQFAHLLPGLTITISSLTRQFGHLPLARLFRCKVRRRLRLLTTRRSLIANLQVLTLRFTWH